MNGTNTTRSKPLLLSMLLITTNTGQSILEYPYIKQVTELPKKWRTSNGALPDKFPYYNKSRNNASDNRIRSCQVGCGFSSTRDGSSDHPLLDGCQPRESAEEKGVNCTSFVHSCLSDPTPGWMGHFFPFLYFARLIGRACDFRPTRTKWNGSSRNLWWQFKGFLISAFLFFDLDSVF